MISNDRQYRSFAIQRAKDGEKRIVEGYALKFDVETVLYTIDGIEYHEIVDRHALDGVNLSDVVLNIDHAGKPLARTKNNTLELAIDEIGLKIRADLDGTQAGRDAYEEVKGGYFDKMSFAFSMNYDEQDYDRKTHTMRIKKISKFYDVSIVTFPAYEQTCVSARNLFMAEAEKRQAEAGLLAKMEYAKSKMLAEIKLKF